MRPSSAKCVLFVQRIDKSVDQIEVSRNRNHDPSVEFQFVEWPHLNSPESASSSPANTFKRLPPHDQAQQWQLAHLCRCLVRFLNRTSPSTVWIAFQRRELLCPVTLRFEYNVWIFSRGGLDIIQCDFIQESLPAGCLTGSEASALNLAMKDLSSLIFSSSMIGVLTLTKPLIIWYQKV